MGWLYTKLNIHIYFSLKKSIYMHMWPSLICFKYLFLNILFILLFASNILNNIVFNSNVYITINVLITAIVIY